MTIEVLFKADDGTLVEVWHSGNFSPSDYLPKTGGTISQSLTINQDLAVKRNSQVEGTQTVKGASTFGGLLTSNGGANLNGINNIRNLIVKDGMTVKSTSTFEQKATFNEDAVFKKSITIEGITKFGNGIEISSGISKFKDKTLFTTMSAYFGSSPTITMAIGDNDTGFHAVVDGETRYYRNGAHLFNMADVWRRNNFDPNSKFNKAGGTVDGSMTVKGTIHSNDDITAFSDKRLKKNIKETGWEEFNKLMEVGSYTYIRRGKNEFGVIAQQLEEIFPRLVTEDGEPDKKTGIKFKRVKYIQFIPLLINAFKFLYKDIKAIKKKLDME